MFSLLLLSWIIHCASSANYDDTIVITTLSPQFVDTASEIGIYYNHPNFAPGDTLVLINEETRDQRRSFSYQLKESSGFVKTGVQTTPFIGILYLYSAAIVRGDEILKKSTMTSRVNWMSDQKSILEDFTIPELFIPGTHQSGAYYRKGPDDHVVDAKTIASKWTLCQDEAILDQLDSGIRYLDVRPGARYDGGKIGYVVSHGDVEMMPMAELVEQVNLFMNITKEIVVISFKEFPKGFDSNEDHDQFIKYLKNSFGQHMFPYDPSRDWDVPLKDFWSSNKRLIISYENPRRTSDLWPGIAQLWCNCQGIDTLHNFISSQYSYQSSPHAAMVQFTHDVLSAIGNFFESANGLRSWADMLGPFILEWFNEEWQLTANVVAVDFYQTTGIVETAIHWNEKRAKARSQRATL